MYRILVLLALALLVASCQPQPVTPPTEAGAAAANSGGVRPTQVVSAQFAGEQVSVVTQAGWDTLAAEDSILLAEKHRSIENAREVDGVLINIFRPQVAGFDATAVPDENVAYALLRYIVQNPNYVGNAALVMPRAFEWGGQPAAFYTIFNGVDRYTLVIAVTPRQDEGTVVVMNVGVPADQLGNLYDKLVLGIQQITIGETELRGADLDALPNPIPFPSDDIEVATDNTPETP